MKVFNPSVLSWSHSMLRTELCPHHSQTLKLQPLAVMVFGESALGDN